VELTDLTVTLVELETRANSSVNINIPVNYLLSRNNNDEINAANNQMKVPQY